MKLEEMLGSIDLDVGEREKAIHYMRLKGIDLHHSIAEYLSSFTVSKVKYCELATTYRYDKRIRKTLYKYIGLFEESIRAFISNRYSDQISQLELTNKMEKYLEEEGMLFKALDRALFSELIQQVIILRAQDLAELFPNATDIEMNLRAILELRNAVSHNRFLLNYMDFKPCMTQHEKKGSLYANLLNFSHFLPPDISSNFIREINDCCKMDPELPNKTPYQTLWVLPKEVILQLDCMEPQH